MKENNIKQLSKEAGLKNIDKVLSNASIQSGSRTYVREIYKNRTVRRITFWSENGKSQGGKMLINSIEEERTKLERQFSVQSEINSNYVVKNLAKLTQNMRTTWIQQDFNCFLSQLPLQSLNFKQRFLIFADIAYGVRDMAQRRICHRSLSPSTISIVKIQGQRIRAKINYFYSSITLQRPKDIEVKPPQKINKYSSPELIEKKSHGLSSDIWSLGCLLNFLLYDSHQNIKISNNQAKVNVPNQTPEWLSDLLRSMISMAENKRPTIQMVIDIVKPATFCLDVLNKYIPIGSKSFQTLAIEKPTLSRSLTN